MFDRITNCIEKRILTPCVDFEKDENGNPILAEYADNDIYFQFTLYDTNGTDETSDDTPIALFSTKDAGENGWISIGQYMQEVHSYRIAETYAPDGFEYA